MEVLFLLFTLEVAFAFTVRVLFSTRIEILLAHARDFEFEHQLVFVLINVDRGHEAGGGPRSFSSAAT